LTAVPVVLNPTAGGGRLLRQRRELVEVARRNGVELDWWLTSHGGHAEELARRAVEEGHSLVLVWGGDGTYTEVARGLLGSATAMGVVPGGTSSVLAHELAVPRPTPRALEPLLRGHDRPMHVGRSDRGDLILLMLSAGPDAVVVADAFRRRRRNDGKTGIAIQAVREFCSRRPLPRLRVRADDVELEGGWVIVGNARCYAGPFEGAPGADPFAPGFEVVVHTAVGRGAALGFGAGIALGRHVDRRDVIHRRASRVVIEPAQAGTELPYQVDGDPILALPVTVEVDPRKLLVRIPHQVS
jgi:diacylglycerol kinase family enzyme